MAKAGEISKGAILNFKGEPYLVSDFQHVNPGKGSAFVRTKLRALQSGKMLENTFKSDETVEFVEMNRQRVQYLYKAGNEYAFMNMENYEQFSVNENVVGDFIKYLKEGLEVVFLVSADNIPVTVDFPKKIKYKVIEAPPGVKGDTATNVTKEITLENGLKARVPLFVKEGDEIVVNTETGEYVERAK